MFPVLLAEEDCLITLFSFLVIVYPRGKIDLGKRGGGVAIYAKDHIAVKRLVEFEFSAGLELLWAPVWGQCSVNNFVFLCGVQCYRPPNPINQQLRKRSKCCNKYCL